MNEDRVTRLRREAIEKPDAPNSHLKLGFALQQAGKLAEAKLALKRALELDPGLIEAWINLGGICFTEWDFEGCLEANRKAIEVDPESVTAHFNLGLGHLYKGEAEETTACFQRVVELDREHAAGHYHLAVGLNALGRTQEAQMSMITAQCLGYTPEPELMRALEKAFEKEQGEGVLTVEIGQNPDGDARDKQQE